MLGCAAIGPPPRIGGLTVLRHFNLLTVPTAISIAFFDATFFVVAQIFSFTGRELLLGVVAGGAGGLYVLAAALWQGTRQARNSLT